MDIRDILKNVGQIFGDRDNRNIDRKGLSPDEYLKRWTCDEDNREEFRCSLLMDAMFGGMLSATVAAMAQVVSTVAANALATTKAPAWVPTAIGINTVIAIVIGAIVSCEDISS